MYTAAGSVEAAGEPAITDTTFPQFISGKASLDRAFRIAIGDLVTNIAPYQAGLLDGKRHVILAGLDYGTPWTRDAALNTWNGVGLLYPDVTRDTLLSVLERRDGKVYIGDQYWDCIVWAVGAWTQYLYTGDKAFLLTAHDAVKNSLAYLEETEFDPGLGLFRGAASSSDGVAGYPALYAEPGGFSGISEWPQKNPERRHPAGFGLPMHALSTNCLYYRAYVLIQSMAMELGLAVDPHWEAQANVLKQSVNERFWRSDAGLYRYLVDPFGGSDYVECLGQAYAILFGLSDESQTRRILVNQYIAPAGVPVLWPTFERYRIPDFRNAGQSGFGRHSGCIWPPFEAIWATTAKQHGRSDLFLRILEKTAEYACRDNQFVEMYHPISGLPYGGLQEGRQDARAGDIYGVVDGAYLIREWTAKARQSWSASGYIRQIIHGLIGMEFGTEGIAFSPVLPEGSTDVHLTHLPYRNMMLHIHVTGRGTRAARFSVNDHPISQPFLPAGGQGDTDILIELAE
jgi:glycogen debranching enzyme